MPVNRRKLATSPAPRPRVVVPASIRAGKLHLVPQFAPQPPTDQRGMNVKAAAKYLGTSSWQIRKFKREGLLQPFSIGNKDMFDRADLDALIERLKAA